MSRTFWLISANGKKTTEIDLVDRQEFRDDALELTMYYVGEGEAIIVSRGDRCILVDGGEGSRIKKNDALGRKIGDRLKPGCLQAIVASHPHQDHTNAYHALLTEYTDRFAPGATYFDNGTPAADTAWKRLQDSQPNMPVQRVSVIDQEALDNQDRIPFGPGVDIFLLRDSTNATTVRAKKYWSVFMLLRYRNAWLLFTGDAHKGYERLILPRLQDLNPRVHLLKVTHHGSSDGTAADFVSGLNPAIAIASTDEHHSHRLEDDVRERLGDAAIYATYDPNRTVHPEKDLIVRTDGHIWQENGIEGVLFEVWRREPALV